MLPAIVLPSSYALKDCGYGPLIDQFEVVVRLNDFNTSLQYQADVGTRTTIWAHYEPYTAHTGDFESELMTRTFHQPGVMNGQHLPQSDLITQIQYPHNRWPTTGITVLNVLVGLYRPLYLVGWHTPWALKSVKNFQTYYHKTLPGKEDIVSDDTWSHSLAHDRMYIELLKHRKLAIEIPIP